MDFNGSSSEGSRQVRVRFLTKMPPPLRAPTSAIAVPSNLTRMGLSEIVNLLLKNGNDDYQHQPFDFLVDGELIRMPLDQFLLAKGISAEKVLEIEYTKVVAPGKQQDPLMHDDWVSAVDGSNPSFILTGCYDGSARLWKGGESCSHVLGGHNDAITSVNIIKCKGIHGENNFHLATGSKDRTLRLWMLNAVEPGNYPVEVQAYKILKGHNSSVQSISAAPSGDMLCSGSWDCSIKLWDVKKPDTEDDSVSVKKRKVGSNTVYGEEPQFEAEAASTLVGHTQCVSSVVWPEADTIYSASWDHSIRQWDVETGKDPWNMVLCTDWWKDDSVISGGADSKLCISSGVSIP